MQMTRGQIKQIALKSAEAVGLEISVQNTLMNLSIQRLATEFRWEHLRKVYPDPLASPLQTFQLTSGIYLYELPPDYLRAQTMRILDAGKWYSMEQKTTQEFMRIKALAPEEVLLARPTYFWIDKAKVAATNVNWIGKNVQRLRIDRYPDKPYSAEIRYYALPDWQDISDEGAYDAAYAPFEDYIMVESMIFTLMDYMKSEDAAKQWQKVERLVKNYLINQNDFDVKQDRINLDPDLYNDQPLFI